MNPFGLEKLRLFLIDSGEVRMELAKKKGAPLCYLFKSLQRRRDQAGTVRAVFYSQDQVVSGVLEGKGI